MHPFRLILALFLSVAIAACATDNSQNQYSEADIGKQSVLEFGTIIAARNVKIQGKNNGLGVGAGALAGGVGGSTIGNGSGQLIATIGGALLGAVAGSAAEQQLQKRDGIEYTITKNSGETVTIVQNIAKDDAPLHIGQRVMVQKSGKYTRVLPAQNTPDQVKRPEKLKVVD
ncbi:MAG: hypothetical protein JWM96_978 [Alphaproteobacteria bacterium]|nr:hypothetical protein [Alphaproteobacteria bacterium]